MDGIATGLVAELPGLFLLGPDLLTGGMGAVRGPQAGQKRGDCSEPPRSWAGGGGADHGAGAGILLRKHAKNAAGIRPVGQDHKEAFVLGGVQGVDGQNSRGGGSTPLGV